MTMQKKSNAGKAIGIGAGIAAAAALGAYFLYGEGGAKNRKKVKGWALKAKGEILERLEQLQDVSEDAYQKIVEQATARYKDAKNVDPKELKAIIAEARRHWVSMKKKAKGMMKGKKTTKK